RELLSDGLQHVLEQVVGQRPRGSHALLGKGDGRRLPRSDPDGEVTVPSHFTQQHDRLVGGHFDPDTYDIELVHTATLGRAMDVWVVGPGTDKRSVPASGDS